ncbi:MAG: ATP-binding protein [Simkaniaceae bacterium]|nr:ATP-binding protein [Simkaniaceae bacterium]
MFKTRERTELLSQLKEGVIELDSRFKVRYINGRAARQLKLDPQAVIGTSFLGYDILKEPIQRCQKLGVPLVEQIDGVDVRLTPYRRGVLVLIDQSQPMGKEFIANASHELRTPITIIKGFAEMLQDLPEVSELMLADITEKIIRNCHRMNHLVKGLLTLADLDNLTESKAHVCDLVSMIDRCGYNLLAVYPESHLETFLPKGEVLIQADGNLVELAIMNLLENGVKYSNGPANLTVTIEAKKESVKMTIADQGIGIPEEDLPHIFERFFTVNKAHSRKLGGAGLGLSIVKAIVQKNGGTISVASRLGEGTTFTLTFSSAPLE